jgi:hypothetical protein
MEFSCIELAIDAKISASDKYLPVLSSKRGCVNTN